MKTACLLFVLLLINPWVHAQHTHHTQPAPTAKNVYLAMMDTMMVQMDQAPMGNSPAATFLHQMLAHHRGAIAMASYEIANGHNREMIQLAKSILIEQQSEIEQMQLWLKQLRADTAHPPAAFGAAMKQTMDGMMNALPANKALSDTDRAFAAVMKPHHQAALAMAKVILQFSDEPVIQAYARGLMASQQIEIDQMTDYLN
ncbi:DUF305 domain-containing protein [Spirosoma radiotolerans]|uniref:DUF305 domain-containing protein n=1 Tax=Spirosoma radiotolerans TaxID=1379870 RepID=A0A0E3ZUB8_9BACT|nr:DUF305 domain-containing protein [Spirosoma radiotolerans]AKD54358.1 hypothetical protein SD10_04960 [Spirosoma radiotolerans]